MRTFEYTYWQDGKFYLGYLDRFPDYETQAYSKEELVENLKELLADLESGDYKFLMSGKSRNL